MTSNAVRQRGVKRDADTAQTPYITDDTINEFKGAAKKTVQREWDYKLALAVITVLAFVTRFWGISHPNQVVFDEVHFGKVRQDMREYHDEDKLTIQFRSLHRTTFSEPTSSMSTLPLASSSLHSPAGLLATMDPSSSRTLATRTSPTESLTSRTDRCLP
jgi:hypothetical protein